MAAHPKSYYRELFDDIARDVSEATKGNQVPEVLAVRGGAPRTCLSGDCSSQTVSGPLMLDDAFPDPVVEPKKPQAPSASSDEDNLFAPVR